MPTLFLAFLAAALASMGARDQILVARLREGLGGHAGLLAVAWLVAAVTAGLAAWLSVTISADMTLPAKRMLMGIALVVTSVELAWPRKPADPQEPTRSLGAIGIVLAAYAITDAARFLTFAIAVGSAFPVLAAIGGAVGSGAALTLGWTLGGELARWRWLRTMRVAIAIVLGLIGLYLAIDVWGLV